MRISEFKPMHISAFKKSFSLVTIFQSLIMYMTPNYAGKDIWLRAQTLNQKLRQNAQTRNADGKQAVFCVINDTFGGHISTLILLMGGGSEPPTRYVSSEHFKTKAILAPCRVFQ